MKMDIIATEKRKLAKNRGHLARLSVPNIGLAAHLQFRIRRNFLDFIPLLNHFFCCCGCSCFSASGKTIWSSEEI